MDQQPRGTPPPTAAQLAADRRHPTFFTAVETARIMRMDESTVYRHLRNGKFPAIKIGGRYVVPRMVIERLIDDVLATGRCLNLAEWTQNWRAEQEAAAGQEARFYAGVGVVGGGP